jgi:hypothetical protein
MDNFDDKKEKAINKVKDFLTDATNLFTNGEPLKVMGFGKSVGEFGEYASEYVLNNRALTNLSYIRTIHNVYVEKKGFTTEIDVIAITEKGLFVLESKNYSGWIFGDERSDKWMQMLVSGQKNQFYNPVKQNEGHIKKLADYLGVAPFCIYSYIVFSDRCELKKIPMNTEHIKIIKRNQLLWGLKDELKNGRTFFTPAEVDAIYNRLLPLTQKTQEEKKQHVDAVRNLQSGMICPLCKKELVLRKGKYGEFYGCSGYPKCTFVRKK